MRKLWIAALIVSLTLGVARTLAAQTIYYVDRSRGNDGNPGTGWDQATASIGAALDLALDSDTVYVAEGTYEETIALNRNVALMGGFPTGGGVRDVSAHETIIDAKELGRVITTRLNSATLVDGFTVTGGRAERGGGIYALGRSIFRNLKIVNNSASSMGGGIYCGQSVTIEDNLILNNRASIAPAIAIIGSTVKDSVTVRGNVIRENLTTSEGLSGGAVFVKLHLRLDFSYNLVAENVAPDGGIFIEESFGAKVLDHNTIARNGARGFSIEQAFDLVLSNSIVYDHSLADVTVKDTVSVPKLRYSDIGAIEGRHTEDHLLSLDPQFADTANADYTLQPTSPCIDAGDPNAPPDSDGTVTDMGAFPYLQPTVDVGGLASPPAAFALEPLFPNPFVAETQIRFSLQEPGSVRVVIYDILGRLVRTLLDGWQGPGDYLLEWRGENANGVRVAPGIYHVVLVSDRALVARRVVMVR